MVPLIVFTALIAVPVLLALILRVNAVFVFVSICSGYLLQSVLSDDVDLALATVVRGSDSMLLARFVLLLLPVLLTLFVLRKSQGKSFLLQLIPLIFSGLLLGVLSLPLLPSAFEEVIRDNPYGNNIRVASDIITAAAVVSNLLLMWTLYKHKSDRRKHH